MASRRCLLAAIPLGQIARRFGRSTWKGMQLAKSQLPLTAAFCYKLNRIIAFIYDGISI